MYLVYHRLKVKSALAQLNCDNKRTYSMLKPKQMWAIRNAQDHDCLAVLRTGYGKTLIIEILPYIYGGVVVVACPLDAIVHQVLKSFRGICS